MIKFFQKVFNVNFLAAALVSSAAVTATAQTAEFAGGVTEFEAPVTTLEIVWPGATSVEILNRNVIMAAVVTKGTTTVEYGEIPAVINAAGNGVVLTLKSSITAVGEYTLDVQSRVVYVDDDLSTAFKLDFTVVEGGSTEQPEPEPSVPAVQFVDNVSEFEVPVSRLEIVWPGATVEADDFTLMFFANEVSVKSADGTSKLADQVELNSAADGFVISFENGITTAGEYTLEIASNSSIKVDGQNMPAVNLPFTAVVSEKAPEAQFAGGSEFQAPLSSFEVIFVPAAIVQEVRDAGFHDVTVTDASGEVVASFFNVVPNDDANGLVFDIIDGPIEAAGSYTLTVGLIPSITVNDVALKGFELQFTVVAAAEDDKVTAEFAGGVTTFEPGINSLEVVWPEATLSGHVEQVQCTVYDSSNDEIYCKNPALNSTANGIKISLRSTIDDEGDYRLVIEGGNNLLVNGATVGTITLNFTVAEATVTPTVPQPKFGATANDSENTFGLNLTQLEVIWEGTTVTVNGGTAVVKNSAGTEVVENCKISKNGTGNGIVLVFRSPVTSLSEAGDYTLVITGSDDIKVDGQGIGVVEMPFVIDPFAGVASIVVNGEGAKRVYNLQGHPVDANGQLPAGIYIVNGVKVIVK